MRDYSSYTLGSLLSHADEQIKRNAMSILKRLQRTAAPVAFAIKPPKGHVSNFCRMCGLLHEDCACPYSNCCP
jgi:hypothetical protein